MVITFSAMLFFLDILCYPVLPNRRPYKEYTMGKFVLFLLVTGILFLPAAYSKEAPLGTETPADGFGYPPRAGTYSPPSCRRSSGHWTQARNGSPIRLRNEFPPYKVVWEDRV
jgi:hypothetical protein